MRRTLRRTVRYVVAVILLFFALAGFLLPLLNGTFFLILALLILSLEMPSLRHKLDHYAGKNDKVDKVYHKLKSFIEKYF